MSRRVALPLTASLVVLLAACAEEAPPPSVAVEVGPRADMAQGCGYSPRQRAQEVLAGVGEDGDSCAWLSQAQVEQAVTESLGGYGETTLERTCWLEVYANALLASQQCAVEDELAMFGVEDARPISAVADGGGDSGYYIHIGGEDEGCYSDADFPLWDDVQDMVPLKDQVRAVVSFLRHNHLTLNGRRNLFFRVVRLCPVQEGFMGWSWEDEYMQLDGTMLTVRMEHDWRDGSISTYSAEELVDFWSEGRHLTHLDDDDPLVAFWMILNPIGHAQIAVREATRRAARALSSRLGEFLGGDGSGLGAIVTDYVNEAYEAVPGVNLEARARARLAGATEEQQRQVAQAWLAFVDAPDEWQAVAEATMAEPLVRSSYDLDVIQICLGFAHGNFHNIQVDVHAYLGGSARYSRFLTVHETDQDVNVFQLAVLGCSYSIDDIGVNVGFTTVDSAGALETAGLEHAIDAVLGADG